MDIAPVFPTSLMQKSKMTLLDRSNASIKGFRSERSKAKISEGLSNNHFFDIIYIYTENFSFVTILNQVLGKS